MAICSDCEFEDGESWETYDAWGYTWRCTKGCDCEDAIEKNECPYFKHWQRILNPDIAEFFYATNERFKQC